MSAAPNRWAWVPTLMPGVAQLVLEHRREHGTAWVNECWQRGMAGEPGWFFAREGQVAIGTPWTSAQSPELAAATAWQVTNTQALLVMRKPPSPMREAMHQHRSEVDGSN